MEATVAAFRARLDQSWLTGSDQDRFRKAWEAALVDVSGEGPVVVAAEDRVEYLAGVLASIAGARPVFLANPSWGETEWDQVSALLPPGCQWMGAEPRSEGQGIPMADSPAAYREGIMIPTGGTGGRVKFAVHTWPTLLAAIQGYAEFWQRPVLHAICPLPVCHVGGLMLALRTWVSGGQLHLTDGRLSAPIPDDFPISESHCSLVGAQLVRALDEQCQWLSDCEAVLVGGGPTVSGLIDHAERSGVRLAAAYGLTEAAATVAIASGEAVRQSPPEGEVLPCWEVSAVDGVIHLAGPARYLGYWGREPLDDDSWSTHDRGELLESGRLQVLGRGPRFIVSGGKKVDLGELESRLQDWTEIREVVAWGQPDSHWGESIQVAVVAAKDLGESALISLARDRLMPEMRPRQWFLVPQIPRFANGKLDWTRLREDFAD
ncbi:MAG: AMP-binding protein [Verrucomicrobiota bacterium]